MSYKFGSGILSGRVVKNGIPVSGVIVTLHPCPGEATLGTMPGPSTTNSDGQYSFVVPYDLSGYIFGALTFEYQGITYPPASSVPASMRLWPVQGKGNVSAPDFDLADPYVGMYDCNSGQVVWVKQSESNQYCTYVQMDQNLAKQREASASSASKSSASSNTSNYAAGATTGDIPLTPSIGPLLIVAAIGAILFLAFHGKGKKTKKG